MFICSVAEIHFNPNQFDLVFDWFFHHIQTQDRSMVAKMSMVLWGLWTQRNNSLWRHANLSSSRVIAYCLCLRHDFLLTTTGLQGIVNIIYRPTAGLTSCHPTASFYKQIELLILSLTLLVLLCVLFFLYSSYFFRGSFVK